MEKAIDPKFHELFEVHENNFCFECGNDYVVNEITPSGGRSPVWASVNNGILLCPRCASIHKGFGPNFSTVKSLGDETWTTNEIEMLKKGGNDKLQDCFEKYNVSTKGPLEFKYKTKAAQHHREKLKALVEGRNLPVPPSLEEGPKFMVAKSKSILRARRTLRNPSFDEGSSTPGEPKNEGTPQKKEGFKLFKNVFGNKSSEKAKEPKKKKKETKDQQEDKENIPQNKENINENVKENVKENEPVKENAKENAKQITPSKNSVKTKGILSGGLEGAATFFKRLTIRKKKDFQSEFEQICNSQGCEEYSFTVEGASGDYLDL